MKGAKKVICAAMPACTFDTFAPHGQMVMAYGIMKEPDSRGQKKNKEKKSSPDKRGKSRKHAAGGGGGGGGWVTGNRRSG